MFGDHYHYALSEGGSWVPRYDGRGGCSFVKTGSQPFRGDYEDDGFFYDTGDWDIWAYSGADIMYSPDPYDSDWLVCLYLGSLPNIAVATDNSGYTAHLYGDSGVASSGDADWIMGNVKYNHIFGNGGDDDLDGGPLADTIEGQGGVDNINGYAGGDTLSGGDDGDYIYGGNDNDWLYGYGGSDILAGMGGDDHLYGGDQDDWLYGDYQGGTGGNLGYDYCYGQNDTWVDTCATTSPYYCDWEDCESP